MPRNSKKKLELSHNLCKPFKTTKNDERHSSVFIGKTNKDKWTELKLKFNYVSDDDFASYLLDLFVKEKGISASSTSTPFSVSGNECAGTRRIDDHTYNPEPTEYDSTYTNVQEDRFSLTKNIEGKEESSSVIVVNKNLRLEPVQEDALNLQKSVHSSAPEASNIIERTTDSLLSEKLNGTKGFEFEKTFSSTVKENDCVKQKKRKTKNVTAFDRQTINKESTGFKTRRKKSKLTTDCSPVDKQVEESSKVENLKNEQTDIGIAVEAQDFRLQPPAEVAVSIRLCGDCELHHVQDACPLQKPIAFISDAVTINDYQNSRETENGESKNFAKASLPPCLELREVPGGVVARENVPAFTQFGPLIGQSLREMEIQDDCTMEHVWEVSDGTSCHYLSTSDPNTSNWLRFVRPAPVRSSRNLEVVSKNGELMFVTTTALNADEELLFWAENRNPSWSHKQLCKTKCGGCNLSFSHTLYYRLHCAVFHDPAYSLTVRKYHCKVCGLTVLGKENIVKHAAEEHNGKGAYQCQFCHKFFLRLNYLEMHRTYGCAANPNRARPLCDYCGRKFCQPQKLKVHIKRMHSEMLDVLRDFQCKHCLKLLGSRAALQRHVKEVHRKDVVGAFTCDRCGKLFQNKSNLKIHMLTHSGVKPFKCKEPDCPAGFTTKQCLQFHYRKIHGLEDSCMPLIERAVEYTFDAYAGTRRPSSVNSDSQCSSDGEEQPNEDQSPLSPPISVTGDQLSEPLPDTFNNSVVSKASKKWIDKAAETEKTNVFDFEEDDKDQDINVAIEDEPIPMLFHHCKQDSSNASLLVEAALDAAEREIESKIPSPMSLVTKESYPIRMSHSPLSMSRPISPVEYPIQDQSQSPHLMESCYSAPSLSPRHPYSLMFPERSSHYDFRLSPPPQIESFPQDELRYDLHHRREETNEDVVQNLSLGLKSKPADVVYKYDSLDERGFECVEGLDMSRTSYHPFVSMAPRYPHALYEPRSYSHSEVLRVVNLSHSVDLSLPRSHHPLAAPVGQTMEPIRILSPPPPPPPYQTYPLASSPSLSPYNRPPHSPPYHHYSTTY